MEVTIATRAMETKAVDCWKRKVNKHALSKKGMHPLLEINKTNTKRRRRRRRQEIK